MNTVRFSEQEAINYTIAKGFGGEEFTTVAWEQRGCLKTDSTYKKLINKLECHFEHVTVEGKGKKREYILSGEKAEPTALKDNRKGRTMPRKAENAVLTDYVYQSLLLLEKQGKLDRTSYSKLGGQLFFTDKHFSVLKRSVGAVFTEYLTAQKIPSVWQSAQWYFEERARKEIKQAVEQLQQENKVVVNKYWLGNFGKPVSEGEGGEGTYFKRLDSQLVEEVEKAISEVVEVNGYTYSQYKQQVILPYKSKNLLETVEDVQFHLQSNFGMNFFYQALDIQVVEKDSKLVVNAREGMIIFLEKTLALAKQKKKGEKHVNAKRISDKFYYLAVMLYVQALGVAVDELELEVELGKVRDSLSEIVGTYSMSEKPAGFTHAES